MFYNFVFENDLENVLNLKEKKKEQNYYNNHYKIYFRLVLE